MIQSDPLRSACGVHLQIFPGRIFSIFEANRTPLVERTMLLRPSKAILRSKNHSIDDWGHALCPLFGYALEKRHQRALS